MSNIKEASTGSGVDALPQEQQETLRKAIRLEWITIGFVAITVIMVGLVAGQSQAMRAAWIEDMLAFLPPIAFLIAVRFIRRAPSWHRPYGYHRSIGIGHLVAATALLTMGAMLLFNSISGLVSVDKPPIGITVLFGHEIWSGWLMVTVMAASGIPPVIVGRMKLKLAKKLHDKLLFADADMNKADWSTAVATIIGVLGIGIGLWWMDAAAAIVVSGSIIFDGVNNLRAAVADLSDAHATTFDNKEEHPVVEKTESHVRAVPWVAQAAARTRDQGHVFHVEVFVVPQPGQDPTVAQLRSLRDEIKELDWKNHDVVIVPANSIPDYLFGPA